MVLQGIQIDVFSDRNMMNFVDKTFIKFTPLKSL